MNNIINIIKGLGINDKQAKVYMALLQLGKATAYRLAIISGIKRPTVYVILGELEEKGFINRMPNTSKQIFVPKQPRYLVEEAEEELRKIKDIIPELSAMTSMEDKPNMIFYEGLAGIREYLRFGLDRIVGQELVGFYAHNKKFKKELLEIFDEYNERLKRKKIKIRGIVPDHESLNKYRTEDKEYERNLKVIPFSLYSSEVSIDIGNNFIKLGLLNDLQGVVIEHSGLTLAFKQIFEMVWDKTK